ncbi:MAG: hypothetical protein HFJ50_09030 [Clostridia bacterium]|nr:hypothetical protein [Clostridia bacterium]
MYGTDVISVLNKAIDNNRSWEVEYGINSPKKDYLDYYVDVEITYFARNEMQLRKCRRRASKKNYYFKWKL